MGLFNMFSKKDKKEEKIEQVIEDYYTPVAEINAELPVNNLENSNKYIDNSSSLNLIKSEIIFDDTKPETIYTAEQNEYINNGYFLSPSYKTVDEFSNALNSIKDESNTQINDDFDYDLNEPAIEEDVFFDDSNNVNSNSEEQNEHKFFTSSIDDIDNYKNSLGEKEKEKTKILGDASIFGINRIDDERH